MPKEAKPFTGVGNGFLNSPSDIPRRYRVVTTVQLGTRVDVFARVPAVDDAPRVFGPDLRETLLAVTCI